MKGLWTCVIMVAVRAALVAQTAPSSAPPPGQMETESIRCWQRTSASAVRFGEPFTLVLTCGVIDNDKTTVVVDQSRLEPAVAQFQPFEVVSGARGSDLFSDNRRFFQYEYTLRLLNGELFGMDAKVPPTPISYQIQSKTGQGGAVTGRENIYLLAPWSVRILSLVPGDATDIRDAPAWTLGDIDAQRYRARVLLIAAGALLVVGGVIVMLTVARLLVGLRKPAAGVRRTSDRTVLKGATRELADVRRQAQLTGWSDQLAARALAGLRLAATIAIGNRVGQVQAAGGEEAHEGQIAVRSGFLWRKKVLASGSATAKTIAAARAGAALPGSLEDLQTALARFTAAAFGRGEPVDGSALDESADAALVVLRRLAFEHRWPIYQIRTMFRRFGAWRSLAWSR